MISSLVNRRENTFGWLKSPDGCQCGRSRTKEDNIMKNIGLLCGIVSTRVSRLPRVCLAERVPGFCELLEGVWMESVHLQFVGRCCVVQG
jgi:hypothetical protein